MHSGSMFERFTDRARRVVVLAQEEARGLQHNYIGTEHILLALIHEGHGVACRALEPFDLPLEQMREEVVQRVGRGSSEPSGRIPFTPRAKKVLELSLREALQLHHNYIGTEHILLGLIREGDGVAAKILQARGADLLRVREAVLDVLAQYPAAPARGRRWLRRETRVAGEFDPANVRTRYGEPGDPVQLLAAREREEVRTTPAADASLTEAQRLAGLRPVGSHHLLLASLADADTAAARVLAGLGVDLDRAKEALRQADVAGTSDEEPAEAGGRQMVIKVAEDRVTIEAADEAIVGIAKSALEALGDQASPPGTIGGNLQAAASLSRVWQALSDALVTIRRRAEAAAKADEPAESGEQPGG
jgi:ATP-dependent Clp protease ATP-binding subunit ClpA